MNVVNSPLPFALDSKIAQIHIEANFGYILSFNTGFAMALATCMFVVFYIKERTSRVKLLQFISGANKLVFWLVSFIFDYAVFIVISMLLLGVLAAYQHSGYSSLAELERIFEILLVFGFAILPFTYVWSLAFDTSIGGLIKVALIYINTGFLFMVYFMIHIDIAQDPLGWVFFICPHYTMIRAMSNLNIKQSINKVCERQCSFFSECSGVGIESICGATSNKCHRENSSQVEKLICNLKASCCDRNFYSFNETGTGISLIVLGLIGVMSFILLFAVEFNWIKNLCSFRKNNKR